MEELKKKLLFETKQSNEFRMRKIQSKTAEQRKAWQTLIYLANQNKNQLRKKIENMKNSGLKKPTVRGLKKICTHVVKAIGLKVDGTLKKGYKYATGGKIVKVVAKKPIVKKPIAKKKTVAKKKPAAKKTVAKKPAAKKTVAKKKFIY